MWIKICGLTTPEAVDAALQMRVDAVGFVFTKSPRQVTPQFARQLAHSARGQALCVAVVRHATQALIDEMLAVFRPDALQADLAELQALRLPSALELLPVMRGTGLESIRLPPRLLYEGPVSGAGVLSDWNAARVLAEHTQLVLAGGLSSANVAAAIGAVRPFGVDVSSGVEERPGLKSPAEIMKFVQAVRPAGGLAPGMTQKEDCR
jgi:phosphoribosylanthranilate isomerase